MTDPTTGQIVAAVALVLGSLVSGGFIGAFINGRNDARKIRLAELQELDQAWATWRAEMMASHDRCQIENAELRTRIVELERQQREMEAQILKAREEMTATRHAVGEAIENAEGGVRRPPSLRTRETD